MPNYSTILLTTFAPIHLQEGTPASPFDFGLSPFWTVVIVLLVIVAAWVAMAYQASLTTQPAAHHGDHAESHTTEGVTVAEAHPVEEAQADVEATPEPAPEVKQVEEGTSPAEGTVDVQPDDLKVIEGIGPKISGLLHDAGIKTFAQLAETEVGKLQEILDAAKLRLGNPETWPEQAKLAASGDWEALEALQDQLKGGRRT